MTQRRFPNFLIVGAARSGTSSLYFYLNEHPDIFFCRDKEPQFFGFHGTGRAHKSKYATVDAYLELFADAGDAKIVGEATPSYLALEESPMAIARYVPDAKLLASLRNPVDRAFSFYEMTRSKGIESAASFEEWISNNDFWLRGGEYAPHIERYRRYFSTDQFMIVLFDDLAKDATSLVRSIHEFLDVEPQIPASGLHKLNAGGAPNGVLGSLVYRATTNRRLNRALTPFVSPRMRQMVQRIRGKAVRRGTMKPETRDWLTRYFREDILRTEELIGRDLGHWLEVPAPSLRSGSAP